MGRNVLFSFSILALYLLSKTFARIPIYILGLYPIGGSWPAGEVILEASRMAIDHINNDPRILQEYQLILIPKDSACDGGVSSNAMYAELYNTTTTKIMIAGAGCSLATEPTAEASHFWNLVQISFSANSPELSFRDMYPRFFRLSLSEYMFNPMRVEFFKHFRWKKIAIIYQRIDFFSLADADFRSKAAEAGLEIVTSEPFTDDPSTQVANIKRLDGRIIFANFYEPQARQVFCAAWKNGLVGPKYVWIIPAWFQQYWWRMPDENIDCTPEQMDEATKGYFGVYQILFLDTTEGIATFSGKTSSEYVEELKQRITEDVETRLGFQESAYGYDTMWAMALAMNKSEERLKSLDSPRSIAEFNYDDDEIGNLLLEEVTNTKFQGLTGTVQFLDTGDRRGIVKLTQNQNGSETLVALYDLAATEDHRFSFVNGSQIIWDGGSPPFDSTQTLEEMQTISTTIFVLITVMALCGALFASSLFAFNIVYKNNKFIKLSSPRINNLMLSGGMLMYVSVIVSGIDLKLVSENNFLIMKKTFLWTYTIGFSIFFGSMFSKTWRVHRIFTSKLVASRRINMTKDPFLFGQVAVLVFLDVLVFVLWEIIDPMYMLTKHENAQVVPNDGDILLVYIYANCTSLYVTYWMVALYAKHGLLLMFGAFLAWETRKVHMVVLNDSKQIGTCVYVVMVSFAIGLPVSILVQNPNGSFCVIALLIFAATTFTICMVFIPKVKMRHAVYPQGRLETLDTQTINGGTGKSLGDTYLSEKFHQDSTEGSSTVKQFKSSKLPLIDSAVNTALSFSPAHIVDRYMRHKKSFIQDNCAD